MSEEHPIAIEVDRINAAVTADNLPQETASGLAAQSMAQSLAIATTDAAALLRHVETTMSAVQAAALTRWVEAGAGEEDPHYQVIVRAAGQVTVDAVALWRDINQIAQQLLQSLPGQSASAPTEAIVVESKPVATPKAAAKTRAKKKASKKAAAKTPAKKKVAKKAPRTRAKKSSRPGHRAEGKPAAKPAPAPVPEAAASNE
jgi:hypothetical protein